MISSYPWSDIRFYHHYHTNTHIHTWSRKHSEPDYSIHEKNIIQRKIWSESIISSFKWFLKSHKYTYVYGEFMFDARIYKYNDTCRIRIIRLLCFPLLFGLTGNKEVLRPTHIKQLDTSISIAIVNGCFFICCTHFQWKSPLHVF